MLPLSGSLQIHIKIVLPEKRLFLYKQCTWSEGSVDDDLNVMGRGTVSLDNQQHGVISLNTQILTCAIVCNLKQAGRQTNKQTNKQYRNLK